MQERKMLDFIKAILKNKPEDWLRLTTHRLDIYEESKAKLQFLEHLETLFEANNTTTPALSKLPTAYDYIRLGHPLSCILEWAIAKESGLPAAQVISFSSFTMPILAVLRKNLLNNKNTQIVYTGNLPAHFDAELLRRVYGYQFDLKKVEHIKDISGFEGSTVFVEEAKDISSIDLIPAVDFRVRIYPALGSILLINGIDEEGYVADIQHVRRRETIAMTPADCKIALQSLATHAAVPHEKITDNDNQKIVLDTIKEITGAGTEALLSSSGLSIQYAIMMGLIDDALGNHPGKAIKFIVPPNCYGGTNDQSRRVAACLDQVEVVDLPVDGDDDMVKSIDQVLAEIASQDAVPYIIAEIPTNPRVEVPDLNALKAALSKVRQTAAGKTAIDPVFILDQTFCPNVHFLGKGEILSTVRTISYASGSKFPSGGKCTAGYCVGNNNTISLMGKIERHLRLCDNEATKLQVEILAQQLPSMIRRIEEAYQHTREFVNFIKKTLPTAKINFVSEKLAAQGFTPSVFSLDLPAKGNTAAEKESHKRKLNHQLINRMITKIPEESKYCVSYGQLQGCYWTIPATSTQGTTKEDDKDYIIRASLSPDMDMERHKEVFLEFVESMEGVVA